MQKSITLNLKEVLFVMALALKPLYTGASGTLQISDYLFVALLFICLMKGRISFIGPQEHNWIRVFGLIIVYQFFVNVIAFVILYKSGYPDERFLRFNLFYVFNFLVCLTVFQVYTEVGYERLLDLYLRGSTISVIVCYLGLVLRYRGEGRERGFFNNPNQLGYFAIIIMTVFVIYSRQLKRSYRLTMIILCLILNILSLSKASIIGAAVLLIAYVLVSNKERGVKKTITIILFISVVMTVIYVIMFANIDFVTRNYYIQTMRHRILYMQYENDTNLGSSRGYDRIKEIGILIITGVGEGAFSRFIAASGKELHSLYASILVCYGLIGFAGYVYLFKKALFSNNRGVFDIMAFSGIFLYGLSHNGIRNTLLWTLLVMLLLRPKQSL